MDPANQTIVEDVFRAIFELDQSVPIESITRQDFPAWDSMAHVALVSALDDEFDLVIDAQDALKIDSFNRCISIVEQYTS